MAALPRSNVLATLIGQAPSATKHPGASSAQRGIVGHVGRSVVSTLVCEPARFGFRPSSGQYQ
jgi:hypothetical protein